MNTRRKLLLAKPTVSSETWHLMHEPYEPYFDREWKNHVEEWYNLCATGVQRENFRTICMEMYKLNEEDEAKAEAKEALLSKYTAFTMKTEVDLLLNTYGKLFTELGLTKARLWLRSIGVTPHHRNLFRSIFGACQAFFKNVSTMKNDFEPIDSAVLSKINRLHLHKSVDWFRVKTDETKSDATKIENLTKKQTNKTTSKNCLTIGNTLQEIKEKEELQEDRLIECESESVPSSVLTRRNEMASRFTKPKSQFDGVNYLSTVGYGHLPLEEAVQELSKKRAAYLNNERYYTVPDEHASNDINTIFNNIRNVNSCKATNSNNREKIGSGYVNESYTIYKAGNGDKNNNVATLKRTCDLTRGVYTEPMSEWTVKTLECEHERITHLNRKLTNPVFCVNNM